MSKEINTNNLTNLNQAIKIIKKLEKQNITLKDKIKELKAELKEADEVLDNMP